MNRLPTWLTKLICLFIYMIFAVLSFAWLHKALKNPESNQDNYLSFNFTKVESKLFELDQLDTDLIQYTRVRHLSPPSTLSYNLQRRGSFSEEFSNWVSRFFKGKRNGVFIEAGANDGEFGSHTLFLEKELGWTGLLIECNPTVIPYLRSKHRKAWIADVCLSPTNTPKLLNFSNPLNWSLSGTLGKPWKIPDKPTTWNSFEVQAIPLYTILAALQWTEVDFFSFDIEGFEMKVLENFPFELFVIKVLIIEIQFYTAEKKDLLDKLLKSKGYNFVMFMKWHNDKLYVHQNYKHLIPYIPHN